MLGALAPFTRRVRLGVIVAGNTYRNPAFLLKQAITVDHISGGRVDFGVGAGWVEREHEAYGWAFPSAKERVDRFQEALEIWDSLQSNERTTYQGTYYQLLDAPFQPKSLQMPRLPVLVGGSGNRMLKLTAQHADIWNMVGTPAESRAGNDRMDEACAAAGRDPNTLIRGVSPTTNLLASPEAFAEGVAEYHAGGMQHIYMPWPRVEEEVPVLRAVARDVLPGLQGTNQNGVATITNRRTLSDVTDDEIGAVISSMTDAQRLMVGWLIEHPDERLDGATIQHALGIERHRDVTIAFAELGDLFLRRGIRRPWSEAQRGYLVTAEDAARLKAAGV